MEDSIFCPKYGNWRHAVNCVLDDRYKTCRKTCGALEAHIKQNEGFILRAKKKLRSIRAKKKNLFNLFHNRKFALKGLPDFDHACRAFRCSFIAKTVRGLKSHITRSHGGRG